MLKIEGGEKKFVRVCKCHIFAFFPFLLPVFPSLGFFTLFCLHFSIFLTRFWIDHLMSCIAKQFCRLNFRFRSFLSFFTYILLSLLLSLVLQNSIFFSSIVLFFLERFSNWIRFFFKFKSNSEKGRETGMFNSFE